jgi:hypothetical protein
MWPILAIDEERNYPMLYRKNIYSWEGMLRIIVGLGLAGYCLFAVPGSMLNYVIAASGAGFAVTGLIGWCPMCAMVGRRLKEKGA